MRVALFDLDGTMIPGNQSYRVLLETARDTGFRPARLRAMLLRQLPGQVGRRLGLRSHSAHQQAWAEGVAWLLAGAKVAEAVDLFHAATARLEPLLRPPLLEEMMSRRREGCRVILVSAVLDRFLGHIAELLLADGFVGTPVAVAGDTYTGRLAGPVCQGEAKPAAVEALAAAAQARIDWPGSHAYGDSWSDLPMLERAGHAVAVTPAPRLQAHAAAAGWRVIV